MGPTVNIPGIGEVKTVYVIGGLAVAAGVVGYAYWKRRTAAADTAAEPFDETALTDDTQFGGGLSRPGFIPASSGDSGSTGSTAPLTNDEWARRALAALVEQGRDAGAAGDAIGAYLAHQPLTPEQANWVRSAIGQVGAPPQGQFSVILVTTPSPTPAAELAAPANVRAAAQGQTAVEISWDPVSDADGYRVYGPSAAGYLDTSAPNGLLWHGLEPGRLYQFTAAARKGATVGPKSSPASATTSAVVNVPAPAPAPTPTSAPRYVTVVAYTKKNPPWNSTLSGIAAHEHTTVASLMRLNPSITNPNVIHPGQRVRVA